MATGTPRPKLISQQSADIGKTWMSFDESPVHAGGNNAKDSPWASFADSSTSATDTSMHISSPSSNYTTAPRLNIVSQLQEASPATRTIENSSVLNRTGVGTDNHPPGANQKHTVVSPNQIKPTHGPGSTISHILRHKSGEGEHEKSFDMPVSTPAVKNQGDVTALSKVAMQQLNTTDSESSQQSEKSYHATTQGIDSSRHDPWIVTDEQGIYYKNQFGTMQSNLDGKINGQAARSFFTKSRLPIPELSHIWELCDMDQDGHLTLLEFCAAFHLVVARKNGYELPALLPKSLLPPLIKMCGKSSFVSANILGQAETPQVINIQDQKKNDDLKFTSDIHIKTKNHSSEPSSSEGFTPVRQNDHPQLQTHQEKWETFSDRTSSSTNLANFDQSLDHVDNLVHPVPLRITPSKHEAHSAKIRKDKPPPRSTDEDDQHLQKFPLPPSHKSLTNPYGSLKNDFSEPDSHTSPRARSSSNSSHSSAGTSDRSLPEMDAGFKPPQRNASDHEYQSDWSSRPLQPRSGSDSSIEVSSLERSVVARDVKDAVPTPPPRPHQQVRASKSSSFESDNHSGTIDVPDTGGVLSLPAPTPPPRPQQVNVKKTADESEGFADFSQFEEAPTTVATSGGPQEEPEKKPEPQMESKPTPAPRSNRDEKPVKTAPVSPDKNTQRKAPTKPPRSRIQSMESTTQENVKISLIKSNSVASPSDNIPVITEKPDQTASRSKVLLQQSIRDLKLQNSKLTRLNADLQQELKDVMQSRITVEMSIHQLRPFSQ